MKKAKEAKPMNPCDECGGTGVIDEVLRYRQPPPDDAVFEKKYRPDPDSTLVERLTPRRCIRCGGRGER